MTKNGQMFGVSRNDEVICAYDEKGYFPAILIIQDRVVTKKFADTCLEQICIGHNGLLYVNKRNTGVICVYKTDGQLVQTFGKSVVDG